MAVEAGYILLEGALDFADIADEDDATAGGIERQLDIDADFAEPGAVYLYSRFVEIERCAVHPLIGVSSSAASSLDTVTDTLMNELLSDADGVICVERHFVTYL